MCSLGVTLTARICSSLIWMPGGVFVPVEPGGHHQAGAAGCGGDVDEDQIEELHRAARSIAADLAEEAMFDRVPFFGVDINTIRAWLGHVSLETTNRYSQADLEMKARALRICAENLPGTEAGTKPSWNCDGELIFFPASL